MTPTKKRTANKDGSEQTKHQTTTATTPDNSAPSPYFSAFILLLNYVSSVSLVILNKVIFETYQYKYATVVSLVHFTVTELGLIALVAIGVFKYKAIRFSDLAVMSLLHAFTIPFCNMSIRFNSIGFHQIGKIMTIPLNALYAYLWKSKTYPKDIILTLFTICFGVVVTGATDIYTTLPGVIFISLCVLTTVASQMRINEVQNVRKVDAMQLLLLLTPMSSVVQLAAVPFIDNLEQTDDFWSSLYSFDYSTRFLVIVGSSAFAAFFVNYTGFLVLGLTSPLTYQVFGHFKMCTILVGGFVLFNKPYSLLNLGGIAISLLGIFGYTYLTLRTQLSAPTTTKATKDK